MLKSAAEHTLDVIDDYQFNTDIPEWDDAGTLSNEERVLITQSVKEVGEVMSNYVGIVRSKLTLEKELGADSTCFTKKPSNSSSK